MLLKLFYKISLLVFIIVLKNFYFIYLFLMIILKIFYIIYPFVFRKTLLKAKTNKKFEKFEVKLKMLSKTENH